MSATGSRGQDPAASASPGDADALTKERVRSAVRHAGWPRQPQCKLGPSLIINRFAFVLPSARCEGGKVTTCVPAGAGGGHLSESVDFWAPSQSSEPLGVGLECCILNTRASR